LQTVALVARIYATDSKTYSAESDYWLDYFLKLAYEIEDTNLYIKQA